MGETRMALLWHLHQPDYRHPDTGIPTLPWARMHALRAYRDLAIETAEREAPVVLNVVPSLLDQLLHYADGGADPHLALTRIPADALSDVDQTGIRATFLGGHPRLRGVHPAYAHLEAVLTGGGLTSDGALTTAQWRDLQVWSTLAWFGATALRDYPVLGELRAKGVGFTEADKAVMLAIQAEILRALPGQLSRAAACPAASLSCSPYFHPILPLLVDSNHARRAMPEVPDSPRFAWPEDALRQLTDARARVEEVLGVRPDGLWPSEGAVSPEVVELVAQAGFRWLVSDDGVLRASDRAGGDATGGWDLGHGVTGFFRDHELSDRIGFSYVSRSAADAIDDLIGGVRERGGLVTLALDGENPWESWPDAGEEFRHRLYDELRGGAVRGVRLDDASREAPVGRVTRLHTGSWIGADLRIWFGDPEDRLAWGWLADARRCIDAAEEPARSLALARLLPAEGSDWMWWFGPEFDTPFAAAFDALFRAHLRAVYVALGRRVPAALFRPLSGTAGAVLPQTDWLSPGDGPPPAPGEAASWVSWIGAGELPVHRGGSMATGTAWLQRARFGYARDGDVWLLAEAGEDVLDAAWEVAIDDTILTAPFGECGVLVVDHVELRVGERHLIVRARGPRSVALRVLDSRGEVRAGVPETVLPDAPDSGAWWWV